MQPQPYKICPQCKTGAALDAQFCASCGHQYRTQFIPPDQTQAFNLPPGAPPASVQPPAQPGPYPPVQPPYAPPYHPYPAYSSGWISVPAGTHSVATAVMLSLCCVVCFGQFYNRQYAKGLILLLVAVVLGVLTGGISALITWPISVIDAGLIASKLNRGQPVREWECM